MRGRTFGRGRPMRLTILPPAPEEAEDMATRPRTRGDCIDGPRPCPWVSCRHHLAIDVNPRGGIRINLPSEDGELDLDRFEHTCSLDVADEGEHTMQVVGELLDISRERVRQMEEASLERAQRKMEKCR